MFVVSYSLLTLFSYLLLPVVGAIVIVVAIKMVNFAGAIEMFKYDKGGFFIFLVTVTICLFSTPTSAIIVGAVISLLRMALYVAELRHETEEEFEGVKLCVYVSIDEKDGQKKYGDEDVLQFKIPGDLTYINGQSFLQRAELVQDKFKVLILDLSQSAYIDHDGVAILTRIIKLFSEAGPLLLVGIVPGGSHERRLLHCEWFQELREHNRIFLTGKMAKEFLASGEILHSTPTLKGVDIVELDDLDPTRYVESKEDTPLFS